MQQLLEALLEFADTGLDTGGDEHDALVEIRHCLRQALGLG